MPATASGLFCLALTALLGSCPGRAESYAAHAVEPMSPRALRGASATESAKKSVATSVPAHRGRVQVCVREALNGTSAAIDARAPAHQETLVPMRIADAASLARALSDPNLLVDWRLVRHVPSGNAWHPAQDGKADGDEPLALMDKFHGMLERDPTLQGGSGESMGNNSLGQQLRHVEAKVEDKKKEVEAAVAARVDLENKLAKAKDVERDQKAELQRLESNLTDIKKKVAALPEPPRRGAKEFPERLDPNQGCPKGFPEGQDCDQACRMAIQKACEECDRAACPEHEQIFGEARTCCPCFFSRCKDGWCAEPGVDGYLCGSSMSHANLWTGDCIWTDDED